MKIKIISLLFLFFTITTVSVQKAAAQNSSVNFQVFYDELSPYGTWIENPQYGYVWIPNAETGFVPYASNGYWAFTDVGWTWVSNYPWGWATFHYGRWFTDPTYGPMWVPDDEWGPGWVTWRTSDEYYGWAPMGFGITFSVAYSNTYNIPSNQWTFVRHKNFGSTIINNYYINKTNNITIFNNSKIINNNNEDNSHKIRYSAGPNSAEIEKRSGNKLIPIAIKDRAQSGQEINKTELQIYRPQVKKTGTNDIKPAPKKIEELKNIKTTIQRNSDAPKSTPIQKSKPSPVNPKQISKPIKKAPEQKKQISQPGIPDLKQQKESVQKNKPEPKQQRPVQQNKPQPTPIKKVATPKPVETPARTPEQRKPQPQSPPKPIQQTKPIPAQKPIPQIRQQPTMQRAPVQKPNNPVHTEKPAQKPN